MDHFPAHQQALLLDKRVVAVLAFGEHDEDVMADTFAKVEHDEVVDCCEVMLQAVLGAYWNGTKFNIQPHESWTVDENLEWQAPKPKPADDYYWDEFNLEWVQLSTEQLAAKCCD